LRPLRPCFLLAEIDNESINRLASEIRWDADVRA
jgi:hypothetical protein